MFVCNSTPPFRVVQYRTERLLQKNYFRHDVKETIVWGLYLPIYLYLYLSFYPSIYLSVSRESALPFSVLHGATPPRDVFRSRRKRDHVMGWPLQDIRLLRGCCARTNHPFIPHAHLHCPPWCNTIARLLDSIRLAFRPLVCIVYIIQDW